MSYCLNPDCQKPQNADRTKFCQTCGSKLLLKERYRAIKLIGQGGFGRTFLSVDEDKPSKPRCVIKQFFPQAQGTSNTQKAAELFEQEAVRLDELGKHPQIPELLAHFTQDNRQYLVQEFIDGQNLDLVLEAEGTFSESQIRDLLNSLLPVLEFIHSHNVIHRDIKPANIILRSDGNLVLVDFGAAKYATGTALLKTGTSIGSPEYVAPEQARGKALFASDLYSLGVTCIHLMTQISPFELFDTAENIWVWRHYLVNNPVSDELSFILDKLSETATNRRYQTVSEVLRALNQASSKLSSNLQPQPQSTQPSFPQAAPEAKKQQTPSATNPKSENEFEFKSWQCLLTLEGHSGSINAVVLSRDGKIIASGSDDTTIKLWNRETGTEITTLGQSSSNWFAGIKSIAISPNGQVLVSGSEDKTIKIWQLNTGKEIHTFTGHSGAIRSVSISPDGQLLASGSDDKNVKIWQLNTGKEISTLTGSSDWFAGVKSVAFSPDGEFLASAGDDKTVKLWRVRTGEEILNLTGHLASVKSIIFSSNGKILISGSEDKTIKLWKLSTGKEIYTFTGHTASVNTLAISRNGEILVSGSSDQIMKVWFLKTKEDRTFTVHSGSINSIIIAPDGQTIITGSSDKTIKIHTVYSPDLPPLMSPKSWW
ncbi:protein kinase domain-containing protein [Floridanema evergladense]|uniref:Protein kinase n=1 Tax=Floridaenema evergladense BLCC-F167 TaxID=3153639 RepID=A0ABV4WM90_9CYAN